MFRALCLEDSFCATAGLKFQILKEFLLLGYAVLLSDVDIVTIANPFDHLHRDSDVEGMSDGWDAAKACAALTQLPNWTSLYMQPAF